MNLSMSIFDRVTVKDKALLARQLATMLGSGLAIDQAFKILTLQTKNVKLQTAYKGIVQDLEQGNSLSFALARQKHIFDPVFIAIVRSGESTGKLDVVLNQLAERLELTEDFNSKVRSALYYPAFVLLTMVIIVILMMVFVVPNLEAVFSENQIELPIATRVIVAISRFTIGYWWVELLVLAALCTGIYFFIKSKKGGSYWDKLKIRAPLIKELYSMIYMARFCRTMSMLLGAGIPIMETLAICADVIQNSIYTNSLRNIAAQVERGIPISVPMQKDPNFPPVVSEMVMVGEQTGKMGTVLTKLAEYYEKETDSRIKGLASLIEPILIVVIGIGVGFLVFSIIWPIYSIAQKGF